MVETYEKTNVFDRFSLMKTSKKPNDFDGLATPATGGPMQNDEKPIVFDGISLMKPPKKSSDLDGLATPATGGL